jgi:serine/threonine protein kinase/tetratricopeptide (TPR) repeat protein
MEPQPNEQEARPTARAVFDHALEVRSAAERQAYLAEACGDHAGLRQKVDALLRAYDDAGDFLESPAPNLALDATLGQPVVDAPVREGPGTEVGPYKLLEQIGEGGMGVVFLAEQQRPVRRQVALKVIKAGMDTRQVVARFEAERQTLALMDHPNIAKVHDAGATESGRPFFVMELVKGVPITAYCDAQRLTPKDRLGLFVQVCQAVQHAHTKGIIHRDLKPSNVLVALYDGMPVPKVIDFGVAKATGGRLTDHTVFTGFGSVVGTPEYMSPEQAELNQLDVDTRSDVYSLGVLLYELLTGSTPVERGRFKAAALLEVLRVVREEEAPRPSTRLSTTDQLPSIAASRGLEPRKLSGVVRGELDWIVMRALEKDRARRYETANGFARDLERYLADEAVQACPPSATYRFRKFARRNKVPLLTAAVLSVVLVAASVISTWQAIRARAARTLAQTRLESETEARKTAVTEAAKATAVNALLQEALGSADPERARGVDYTVRQLLDDISTRLGDELKDQPEVAASVHATLGSAYRSLGVAEKAQPHLLAAMEWRIRALGPDHPDVGQILLDLAWNARQQGNLPEAEARARRASAICRKYDNHGRSIRASCALMHFVLHQGRDGEAEAIADEALAFARAHGEHESLQVAVILHHLASLRTRGGDPAEGERLARESIALLRRLDGDGEVQTAWAIGALGAALSAQGRYAETEASQREALAILRKHYGETSNTVAQARSSLERTLATRGDHAGAEALRAETAARLNTETVRPSADPRAQVLLGNKLRKSGALDAALEQFSSVIVTSPASVDAWDGRGEVYAALGRWDDAAANFAEAARLAPNHPYVSLRLAMAHLARGDHGGYRNACAHLLERAKENPSPDRERLAVHACGMAPDAGVDMTRILRLAEQALADEPKTGSYLAAARGAALCRAGQYAEAIERLTAAEAVSGAPAQSRLFLAIANHHLGRHQDACEWLDKAVRGYERQGPATRPATTNPKADAANWQHPLTVRLLRAEAEALLASDPGKR